MKKTKETMILVVISLVVCIITFFGIRLLIQKTNKVPDVPKVTEANYFIIKEDGKEGVIDRTGKKIVDPKFEKIIMPNFSYPLFFAYNGDKQTILDDKSEFSFTKRQFLKENAKIQNVSPVYENTGIYNIVRPHIKYQKEDKFGLMDLNGMEITKAVYDEIRPLPEDNEADLIKRDGMEGLLNVEGREILKPEYKNVYPMNVFGGPEQQGQTSGYGFSKESESGRMLNGYITADGHILLEPKYENINKVQIDSENQYLIVSLDGKQGAFRNRDKVVDFNYDEITYNKNFFLARANNKYSLYDLDGKNVHAEEFDNVHLKESYAIAKLKDTYIVYDASGKEILKTEKEPTEAFGYEDEEYVVIREKNNRYSINNINKEGKLENIIDENKTYKSVQYFFDDIVVCLDGEDCKEGDEKCKIASEYKAIKLKDKKQSKYGHIFISIFANTKMLVGDTADKKSILYNKDLEEIKDVDMTSVTFIKDKKQNGIFVQSKEGLLGITEEGKKVELKDLVDRKIYPFKENDKYGYKDKEGKTIIEPIYERAELVNKYGFAGVKKDGKWGVISDEGKVIVDTTIEEKSIADIFGEFSPIFISNYIVASNSVNDAYNLNNLPSLERFKFNEQNINTENQHK